MTGTTRDQRAKGLCPCGRVGTVRALERTHVLTCAAYAEVHASSPRDPRLDLASAYLATQTASALEESEISRADHRETVRLGYRAANDKALAAARERWHGEGRFHSSAGKDGPVPAPPLGVISQPAHLAGTARSAALTAMAPALTAMAPVLTAGSPVPSSGGGDLPP